MTTLMPVLSEFNKYYKAGNDVATLAKVFKLGKYADGEFGETLSMTFFECYMHNKSAFITAVKKSSDKKIRSLTKQRLIYGIRFFFPQLLNANGIDQVEVEKQVQEEIKKVERF